MELVYMDGKKEPYTTSAIIAECAGIKHHAIQEHIRKQIGRLEQYQAFEDMVIAMIGLNMSYQEIKAMAFRNKKTRQGSA